MKSLILKIKTIIYDFFACLGIKEKRLKEYYISKVSRDAPWVYISYITAPFYKKNLSSHQNQREMVAMVKVLNDLGYNVYVQDYMSKKNIPFLRNVRMIFGHTPNIIKASEKYPGAVVVLYHTGAYVKHYNKQVIKMTDFVNRRYQSKIPYYCLQNIDNNDPLSVLKGYEISNKILQIGSKFTLQTLPSHLHEKVVFIHQSTQVTRVPLIEDAKENEFFYMASSGNMLKGVPLLIEYFSKHQHFILHIIGLIEKDYMEVLNNILTPNIKLHGFMDVNSLEFAGIVSKCNFVIYPSGSEGVPGAVLCAMQYGLIPVVTPWAAFDEIEDYGYLMDYNWNVDSIAKGVEWALSLNPQERLLRKKRCSEFVVQNFNIERFSMEFRDFCKSVL